MHVPAPAEVGISLDEVDTPALIVDLDAFEKNLDHMALLAKKAGVLLRPHAKAHKSAAIAQQQIERGAVGVCAQKVSEAEALVNAGIQNVLISNEIVGAKKVDRLVDLSRRATISVCVDHIEQVRQLSFAAQREGTEVSVLIEVNVGGDRCGVLPGQPALALAQAIDDAPGLRFSGLQAYHNNAQHTRLYVERGDATASAIEKASATATLLGQHGLPCEVITGAGTGTFTFEANSGIYDELQVGSYIFMDADYAQNLDRSGEPVSEFQHSLFVYTTVMSVPSSTKAVVDAGIKSMSFECGFPRVHQASGIEYVGRADEHGVLEIDQQVATVNLGDKLLLIPGHCDPTVNLHEWFVGVRDNKVEAVWPIDARGMIF
jgi:D-serine deaminase-like pyridoxal phosphate-dependent protein